MTFLMRFTLARSLATVPTVPQSPVPGRSLNTVNALVCAHELLSVHLKQTELVTQKNEEMSGRAVKFVNISARFIVVLIHNHDFGLLCIKV